MHFRAALIFSATLAFAQNAPPPSPGADLSGMYTPDRDLDPGLGTAAGRLVDYGGIPLNEAGRMYALAWDASRITLRQQQCAGYVPPYMFVAPGNYRIFEDRDPFTQQLLSISCTGRSRKAAIRSSWMAVRILPPTPLIRFRDFLRANTKATFLPWRPLTLSAVGSA